MYASTSYQKLFSVNLSRQLTIKYFCDPAMVILVQVHPVIRWQLSPNYAPALSLSHMCSWWGLQKACWHTHCAAMSPLPLSGSYFVARMYMYLMLDWMHMESNNRNPEGKCSTEIQKKKMEKSHLFMITCKTKFHPLGVWITGSATVTFKNVLLCPKYFIANMVPQRELIVELNFWYPYFTVLLIK